MTTSANYSLRWNDFGSSVAGIFRELRESSDFFDVTLGTSDSGSRTLQAHKVILSASSDFFKETLRQQAWLHSHPRPFIYLRGVSYSDLQSILDFVYHGEVSVAQDGLRSFLAVAEELQIKGLIHKGQAELQKPSETSLSPTSLKTNRAKDSGVAPLAKRPKKTVAGSVVAQTGNNNSNKKKNNNNSSIKEVKVEPGFRADEDGEVLNRTSGSEHGLESDGTGYESATGGSRDGAKVIVPEISVMQFLESIATPGALRVHHCTLCGMKSPHPSTMRRHMLRIHASPVELPCRNCLKIFKNSPNLEAHERLCIRKGSKIENHGAGVDGDDNAIVVVPEFADE